MSHLNENRLGCITASEVHKILGKPRSGEWTATAETYLLDKVAERIYQRSFGFDGNAATEWGHDHEDEAREAFGQAMFSKTHSGAFTFDPVAQFGGTNDGNIDGVPIEIKCPFNPTNYLKYRMDVKAGQCPKAHYAQIQAHIHLMDAAYGYFIAYDPRIPEPSARLSWLKVERDQPFIDTMLDAVNRGNEWIQERVKMLQL